MAVVVVVGLIVGAFVGFVNGLGVALSVKAIYIVNHKLNSVSQMLQWYVLDVIAEIVDTIKGSKTIL